MSNRDDSVAIHVTDRGDGPPLIFLHGAWMSGDMWAPQVERFADDYRVVTLDGRGHGRSDGSRYRDYSVELFAADLRAAVESIGIDEPVVCGLSLGGLVAQTYARDHPVRGLVLADTVRSIPPIPMTRWQKRAFFPKASVYPLLRRLGPDGAFRLLLHGVETSLGRPWLATTPGVRDYAFREIDRIATDDFVKVFDALYDFDPHDLSDIEAPSVVIHGDHEAPPVKAQNKSLSHRLDADRVIIDRAGHLANMDNPAAFNAAVEEFLTDLT